MKVFDIWSHTTNVSVMIDRMTCLIIVILYWIANLLPRSISWYSNFIFLFNFVLRTLVVWPCHLWITRVTLVFHVMLFTPKVMSSSGLVPPFLARSIITLDFLCTDGHISVDAPLFYRIRLSLHFFCHFFWLLWLDGDRRVTCFDCRRHCGICYMYVCDVEYYFGYFEPKKVSSSNDLFHLSRVCRWSVYRWTSCSGIMLALCMVTICASSFLFARAVQYSTILSWRVCCLHV